MHLGPIELHGLEKSLQFKYVGFVYNTDSYKHFIDFVRTLI